MQYTIVLEPGDSGGFAARCVEIPGTVCHGVDKKEALARLKKAIRKVQQTWKADLHHAIRSLSSEIIRIEVTETA